jgi:O-antigen/teichoic acid export membrane protein
MSGRPAAERARRAFSDPLWRSAYSLMLNSTATGVLGLIFWILAARAGSSAQVGQASVVIAAMMTLSSISQLNLGNVITRFLPQAGTRARRWILSAYALAIVATAVGAGVFLAVVPRLSEPLRFLGRDATFAAVFVAATALWSIFGLQDAVMTALRRAPWVPLENAAFGALKLAFLPALAAAAVDNAIFVSWMLPMVLLLVPVNWLIFRRFVPEHVRRHPDAPSVAELLPSRRVRRFLVADYLGSVLQQAALALPALLVVALLGSRANAYFYVPFMLVTAFDTLFFNASTSLVVEGAFDSDTIGQLTRRIARRCGTLVLPGIAILVVAAPLLLLPFGATYAVHGTGALRLLAAASIFRVTISLAVAVARVRGAGGRILSVYLTVVLLLVPLLLILCPGLGIEGAALAWLGANAAAAGVVAPSLISVIRSRARPPTDPRRPPARLHWPNISAAQLGAARDGGSPRRGAGVPWRSMSSLGMVTSLAAVVVSFGGAPPGLRFGVLAAFVCTAPGTALLGALEPGALRVSPAAVMAAGLALGAATAQAMLWIGMWAPSVLTATAGALCLIALVGVDRRRR